MDPDEAGISLQEQKKSKCKWDGDLRTDKVNDKWLIFHHILLLLQVKQQLLRFNTQTSSRLRLANLLHASPWFLYRSANKWKWASASQNSSHSPKVPLFLPANVIEGKQSSQLRHNLPDKTHIYHMASLCGLLYLRAEQTESKKLANHGSVSQEDLGVSLSGCGLTLKHMEREWGVSLSDRSELLLWKVTENFNAVAS